MPGLVPGIDVLSHLAKQGVDGRDKPGHDEDGLPKAPQTGLPAGSSTGLVSIAARGCSRVNAISMPIA
jgi:hypothetical protein